MRVMIENVAEHCRGSRRDTLSFDVDAIFDAYKNCLLSPRHLAAVDSNLFDGFRRPCYATLSIAFLATLHSFRPPNTPHAAPPVNVLLCHSNYYALHTDMFHAEFECQFLY